MLIDYDITFSLMEWLAITGLAQSVLILVYIASRARSLRQAAVPFLYFFFLALAFGFAIALRIQDLENEIRLGFWLAYGMGAPLCYLLVLQVTRIADLPPRAHFLVLLVMPAIMGGAMFAARWGDLCEGPAVLCDRFFEVLYWSGAMGGALCLLGLWLHGGIFRQLWQYKRGRERYWLAIMLVVTNILGVAASFLYSTGKLQAPDVVILQITLGLSFVYLVGTALFRVYPPPLQMNTVPRTARMALSPEDKAIADKVRHLMEREKLYQEPSFSRAELAREVGVSENTLSRVINRVFDKSFPQMLNEFRVEDAKNLLKDPSIPVQVAAFEAGFNSLASFNRVFRDQTGDTPSAWRQQFREDAGKKLPPSREG